jgi:hypothetical protein
MTKIKQNAVEQGNETYIQHWVDVKSPVQTVLSTLALLRVEFIILVRHSVIVTILRAGRLKNRGRVPVRVEIPSCAKSPDQLGGRDHPAYSVGIWGSSPTVYAAGAWNWSLISVWKWVEPYLHSATCFHIVHKDRNTVAVDWCFLFFSLSLSPHATSCVVTLRPVMLPAVWPYRPSYKQFLHIRPVCPKIFASRNESGQWIRPTSVAMWLKTLRFRLYFFSRRSKPVLKSVSHEWS